MHSCIERMPHSCFKITLTHVQAKDTRFTLKGRTCAVYACTSSSTVMNIYTYAIVHRKAGEKRRFSSKILSTIILYPVTQNAGAFVPSYLLLLYMNLSMYPVMRTQEKRTQVFVYSCFIHVCILPDHDVTTCAVCVCMYV